MSFFRDFFRNLFGGDGNNESTNPRFDGPQMPKNGFRNPIWQNNDDNDDDYDNDYRHFPNPDRDVPFQIFTNPFEIMRYFESQMNNMMKDMMEFSFDEGVVGPTIPMLPQPDQKENNLRDQFLKSKNDGSSHYDEHDIKVDMDLDGKVTADDVSKVLKNSDEQQLTLYNGSDPFRSTTRFQFSPNTNFSMEQIRSFTDHAGNTETIIKRQVGDKIHTTITKRDKNGVETKTETFSNTDENIKDSSEMFPKIGMGRKDSILWDKFFGSGPKL